MQLKGQVGKLQPVDQVYSAFFLQIKFYLNTATNLHIVYTAFLIQWRVE